MNRRLDRFVTAYSTLAVYCVISAAITHFADAPFTTTTFLVSALVTTGMTLIGVGVRVLTRATPASKEDSQ